MRLNENRMFNRIGEFNGYTTAQGALQAPLVAPRVVLHVSVDRASEDVEGQVTPPTREPSVLNERHPKDLHLELGKKVYVTPQVASPMFH